jgi:hypothetical protein
LTVTIAYWKLPVTVPLAFIVIVQGSEVPVQPDNPVTDHPVKLVPEFGTATNVTCAPTQ